MNGLFLKKDGWGLRRGLGPWRVFPSAHLPGHGQEQGQRAKCSESPRTSPSLSFLICESGGQHCPCCSELLSPSLHQAPGPLTSSHHSNSRDDRYDDARFTGEETEAQRELVTGPGSHGVCAACWRSHSSVSDSKAPFLPHIRALPASCQISVTRHLFAQKPAIHRCFKYLRHEWLEAEASPWSPGYRLCPGSPCAWSSVEQVPESRAGGR